MTKKRELPVSSSVVTRSKAKKDLLSGRSRRRHSASIHGPKYTNIGTTKNTTTKKKKNTKKKNKPNPTRAPPATPLPCWPVSGPFTEDEREKYIEHLIKHSFERKGDHFSYGPEHEKRTCILSRGDTLKWTEKASKTSWVAVNGTKTICVVAIPSRSELQEDDEWDLCRKTGARPFSSTDHTTAKALYEMIDTSGALRQRIGPSSETGPVAVVSVAPGTIQDHETGDESQQILDAIKFLEAKLKHRPALTIPETVQVAVCALYYLFGPKFKSNEIQIRVSRSWGENVDKLTSSKVEEFLSTIDETTCDDGN